MCGTHYERWRRNGTTETKVELHGMVRTPEWNSWFSMRQRCYHPTNKDYTNYGARGIRVCPQWNRSFSAFLRDMGKRPEGTTLDRIDVNGDYEPSNCRWADSKTQNRNRRNNSLLTFGGVTRSTAEWAEVMGIGYVTLKWRLRKWDDVERALTYHVTKRTKAAADRSSV